MKPQKWHSSDDFGPSMRVEFFGCEADEKTISCSDNAEKYMLENTPDGTAVTRSCGSQCREANTNYKVFHFESMI